MFRKSLDLDGGKICLKNCIQQSKRSNQIVEVKDRRDQLTKCCFSHNLPIKVQLDACQAQMAFGCSKRLWHLRKLLDMDCF